MPVAKFCGIDNILTVFEEEAVSPYWALWQGKVQHKQFTGDDMEESIDQLSKELYRIKDSGNNAVLVLHPHINKLSKTDILYPFQDSKKYPVKYPIYCTVFEKTTGLGAVNMAPANYMPVPIDSRLTERLNSIESTLNALVEQNNEEEEEEIEEKDELSKITKFLENDTVKSLIGLISGSILKNQPAPTVQSLGAINEEWEHYIAVLFSKGLTLEHLKKLAAMPEKQIQNLLMMI